MQQINIEGLKFYAYHGCLEEEARIGGNYIVDVQIITDFSLAADTDDLTKTIDYCAVYEICKAEMGIRSKLIEHVCQRIHTKLCGAFNIIHTLRVKVVKLNPPINGHVEQVSVVIDSAPFNKS
jgi:7,8-dihydroneopterin aldolase/epimerase/oxygenase